ncbi:MAG TPA: hypothetical protein PKE63_11250 [Lacibacter sp.]|nr:hypothetical protein [Lacibacter sp.]HMO88271.1 hypothetical protein [Lacibacter sp.]HMP87847.1 hypothetical protein [Lacibacter sp.]
MQPVSFPFAHQCFFRLYRGQTPMALVEAEEAVTPAECYQALNHRSRLHFTRPLVLHFECPEAATPVWFGFAFDVEVLVVGTDGIIHKIYPVPRHREGDGFFVQFFSEYACAILVPSGFCREWNVQEGVTCLRRIRTARYATQTA